MKARSWKGRRVLVIGDVMLDRFVYGRVRRISPEAPIPVVEVSGERALPGGAANVAHNVAALGGEVTLLGVVGSDPAARQLEGAVAESGVDGTGLLRFPGRTTTVKTRIVAHQQQVVRVDREEKGALPEEIRGRLGEAVSRALPDCGALVASDYAKGVLDPVLLTDLGRLAGDAGIPYVVDPKPVHFPYPGATVVTPNRQEATAMHGSAFSLKDLPDVALRLLAETDWEAILFTLGADGMALAGRNGDVDRISTRSREVYDVTGAGDTVVAALSLALASGFDLLEAARIANYAAGVVVGKVGTAVCSPEELSSALADETHG